MKQIACLLFVLATASPVSAQTTAIAGQFFGWAQAAPTPATAQGYTYKLYVDAAAAVTVTATCVAGATSTTQDCTTPIPVLLSGPHTASMSASNAAGESAKGPALTFTFVVPPQAPGALTIK